MGNATFTRSTGKWPQRINRNTGRRQIVGTITLSNSYATNGDTLTMTNIPFDHVTDLIVQGGAGATSTDGRQFKLGGTALAPKIVCYGTSGEVANATDLSAQDMQVIIEGY